MNISKVVQTVLRWLQQNNFKAVERVAGNSMSTVGLAYLHML